MYLFNVLAGSGLAAAAVVLAGFPFKPQPGLSTSPRRWLPFLFAALLLLLAAIIFGFRWQRNDIASAVLMPVVAGALAALFVCLLSTPAAWSKETLFVTVSGLLAVTVLLVIAARVTHWITMVVIVGGSGVTALVWQTWAWRGKRRVAARAAWLGLLVLAAILWIVTPEAAVATAPRQLRTPLYFGWHLLWPGVSVALAARLMTASLFDEQTAPRAVRAAYLTLSALLLLAVGCLVFYEAIWDHATDGLGALTTLTGAVIPTAVAAAMLMGWALPGGRRLAALAFAFLVPAAAAGALIWGFRISPPVLTEARAEAIHQAVLGYHDRRNRYPDELADLGPWYGSRLFEPMIFRRETWCYEGGENYYRLGYVYQPFFGGPANQISVRIHAAAGEPPQTRWPCDDQAAVRKGQAP